MSHRTPTALQTDIHMVAVLLPKFNQSIIHEYRHCEPDEHFLQQNISDLPSRDTPDHYYDCLALLLRHEYSQSPEHQATD